MKRFVTLLFLFFSTVGFAQKISFEADAPSVVTTGEVFRVEFSLNAKPDNFSAPNITGFDVLAGPTTSQGQSISIVNGNMTQTVNFTYTYVLQAVKAGKFTIPAATVSVDGRSYTSREQLIEVVADDGSGGSSSGGSKRKSIASNPSSAKLGADDILLRASVNKNTVYKGQPIRVTFKLYTRVPLSGFESPKYPAFNGFWGQELNVPNARPKREVLNSKVYESTVLKEYLLFPQQAGTLFVEQFDLTAVAQIITQSRRQSLIDDFFGGAIEPQEVRKRLVTSPIKITVKELPSGAPDSFNGAVGKFTMTSDINTQNIAANSAATLSLKISGAGNLPLIQAPKLALPSSFEQYNIKTTESLNNSASGITGYRQFDYPFIARAEGSFSIKPIEFAYFDPDQIKYITLSSQNYDVTILPDSTNKGVSSGGMVSGLTKEDIKILGQDIRFIKIGKSRFSSGNSLFMWSPLYFVSLFVIIGFFVFLLIYLNKKIKEMRNMVIVKGKRANKVALQRFKAAAGYMKNDDMRHFYEEMLRALWGYVSDKLNIPVANLTKENVKEKLQNRGVSEQDCQEFIRIITECEYAQYSPATSGQMQEIYGYGVNIISRYESIIK